MCVLNEQLVFDDTYTDVSFELYDRLFCLKPPSSPFAWEKQNISVSCLISSDTVNWSECARIH